jgi:phage terminase large subunit-like protein
MSGQPKARKKRLFEALLKAAGERQFVSRRKTVRQRMLDNIEYYGMEDVFDEDAKLRPGAITGMSADRRDEIAQRGLEDLHFFSWFIMGRTRLPRADGFHGDYARWLEKSGQTRKAGFIPRGHFKTTMGTVDRNLQKVCRDPMSTHIIVTGDMDLRNIVSEEMRKVIEHDGLLRKFYPHMVKSRDRSAWKTQARTIHRPSGDNVREPTWEFRSAKQPIAGRHVDSITCDDLVNEVNSQTPKMQDPIFHYIRMLFPTMDTDDLLISGTRYADFDAYGQMLDDTDMRGRFDVWIEPLCKQEDDGSRTFLFPEEWDEEAMADAIAAMGLSLFSCQYMNDPLPIELQRFRETMFQYYHELPDVAVYVVIDPASGEGSSQSAIVVVGIDAQGNLYVMDFGFAYPNTMELANAVFRFYQQYWALQVACEVYSGGKQFVQTIRSECTKRGIHLPLVDLPTTHTQKEARILWALEPVYIAKIIYHSKLLERSPIEEQLLRFPKGKNKDIVDALGHAVDLARRYGYSGSSIDPATETEELRELREKTTKHTISGREMILMAMHDIDRKAATDGTNVIRPA